MNFFISAFDAKKSTTRSVLFILAGLFFCFFPNLTPNLFVVITGGIILFIGAVSFLSLFMNSRKPAGMNYFNLGLSLVVGLALIIAPGFWVKFVMILLGIFLAVCGISQLASLMGIRKSGVKTNAAEYVLGAVLLFLGIFICFRPIASEQAMMILVGCGCIFYGLTNLLFLLQIRAQLKKSGKHIVNDTIEDVDFEITEK
ncbi:MAG: DUF308 domain-containing protein [Bacteroides sp.]|nr:DUF308 domain-containing protein [Ruminococcus flavefaciens]MCM1554615.1 DUF308 domain-containing protein [Bacteroides sp.]